MKERRLQETDIILSMWFIRIEIYKKKTTIYKDVTKITQRNHKETGIIFILIKIQYLIKLYPFHQ